MSSGRRCSDWSMWLPERRIVSPGSGYYGSWLPAAEAQQLTLANAPVRPLGAALGAGVLAVLPASRYRLAEAARVTRHRAAESAGQRGPCLNGLPRIAAAVTALAGPDPTRGSAAPEAAAADIFAQAVSTP